MPELSPSARFREAAAPTRRERRKLEVRARLLGAAESLFDQHGIAATKVSEICERADVAQKTFFNHFATKQDLLRALAGSFLEELLVDVEEARKRPGSTPERLAAFFACIAENALEAGPMRRELLTEIIHVSQTQRSGSANARALRDAFGALVADGLTAGAPAPTPARRSRTWSWAPSTC